MKCKICNQEVENIDKNGVCDSCNKTIEQKGNKDSKNDATAISMITLLLALFFSWSFENVLILFIGIYALVFAFIGASIGIKKGINSGFWWGYFLGIIGIIIICLLPDENQNIKNIDIADQIKKYKELLDSGAITQEEFEVKKKQLLDL